jgi:hypothetical protein
MRQGAAPVISKTSEFFIFIAAMIAIGIGLQAWIVRVLTGAYPEPWAYVALGVVDAAAVVTGTVIGLRIRRRDGGQEGHA